MRLTVVALCVVALALTAIGWTETEREAVGDMAGSGSAVFPFSEPERASRSVSAQSTHPVSFEAKRWHPNPAWMRDALCIYRHENGGYGWHANTGNGYSGGMQFLPSTWHRAGGRGLAYQWAAREQLYRAWRIWRMYPGGSWVEWGTRGMCGLG